MQADLQVGGIVRFRNREWVLLPSNDSETYRLRPLTGMGEEPVEVDKRLSQRIGYTLPFERVEPSMFPDPDVQRVSDATSVQLLWHAARLLLREGAAPLRSMGRISIRPHLY